MPEITPDEVVALLTPLFPSNRLSDTQELVLRGSWQRKSYQEIATAFDYDTDYIKGVGSQLWRSLSQILGTLVSKSTFHAVIHSYFHQSKQISSKYEIVSKSLTSPDCASCLKIIIAKKLASEKIRNHLKCYGLKTAIDVSFFYGRITELSTLKHWILEENCRLIAILGMVGIGKTALSVKLMQEIKQKFEFVFYYNLNTGLSLSELLTKICDYCLISPPPPEFIRELKSKFYALLNTYNTIAV